MHHLCEALERELEPGKRDSKEVLVLEQESRKRDSLLPRRSLLPRSSAPSTPCQKTHSACPLQRSLQNPSSHPSSTPLSAPPSFIFYTRSHGQPRYASPNFLFLILSALLTQHQHHPIHRPLYPSPLITASPGRSGTYKQHHEANP